MKDRLYSMGGKAEWTLVIFSIALLSVRACVNDPAEAMPTEPDFSYQLRADGNVRCVYDNQAEGCR